MTRGSLDDSRGVGPTSGSLEEKFFCSPLAGRGEPSDVGGTHHPAGSTQTEGSLRSR